ncbi:uncharacterized protein LOC132041189 [Lycium ferocissimum]|uniref:uncharacterized protein LOC132041189 n=1 Tax=Lycium ferocissimum TaxID=112874 RepID=UPI0028161F01|nr:uncharacterized protein LOC132041189 [Lycium ferocissimum]
MYKGVTRHHHHGRWKARIGRVVWNKDLYLGPFSWLCWRGCRIFIVQITRGTSRCYCAIKSSDVLMRVGRDFTDLCEGMVLLAYYLNFAGSAIRAFLMNQVHSF